MLYAAIHLAGMGFIPSVMIMIIVRLIGLSLPRILPSPLGNLNFLSFEDRGVVFRTGQSS